MDKSDLESVWQIAEMAYIIKIDDTSYRRPSLQKAIELAQTKKELGCRIKYILDLNRMEKLSVDQAMHLLEEYERQSLQRKTVPGGAFELGKRR